MIAAGAWMPLRRVGSEASAQFAQQGQPPGDGEGEQGFTPFDFRRCPESRALVGSGWRGWLRASAKAQVQTLCGQTGRWSYFRAHPEAGRLQVEWMSQAPVVVAMGWGACDSPPRFCGQAGRQLISNWPQGASLWVAVLDPAAPIQQDDQEDQPEGEAPRSGYQGDASSTESDSGSAADTSPYPGIALTLAVRPH